jgi:hypothetical protein
MKDLREYAKQTNVRLAFGMFAGSSFSDHSHSLCFSCHRVDPQACPTKIIHL